MYHAAFLVEAQTEITGTKEIVKNQSSCQFAKQIPKVNWYPCGIPSISGVVESSLQAAIAKLSSLDQNL